MLEHDRNQVLKQIINSIISLTYIEVDLVFRWHAVIIFFVNL